MLIKDTHHPKIAKGQVPSLKTHTAEWDGRNGNDRKVSNGVYFYRLGAGDFGLAKKVILLR